MARALISEDRLELGRINPIIGGSHADTLRLVRAAVAFIGASSENAAGLDAGTIGVSPDSSQGAALLCSCIDVALGFEIAELSVVEIKVELDSAGQSIDSATARTEIVKERATAKTTNRKRG